MTLVRRLRTAILSMMLKAHPPLAAHGSGMARLEHAMSARPRRKKQKKG